MQSAILNFIYFILTGLFLPLIVVLAAVNNRFYALLKNKLVFSKQLSQNHQKSIVIHSASVGEATLAIRLARSMQNIGFEQQFIFTINTKSGYDYLTQAGRQLQSSTVVFLPFDFSFFYRHMFGASNAKLLIIIESEYWPNLLLYFAARSVPIFNVNARMSLKTSRLFNYSGALLQAPLKKVDRFYYTDNKTADNLLSLGVLPDKLVRCSSFKVQWYKKASSKDMSKLYHDAFGRQKPVNQFIFVAGSLQPAELNIVIKAWQAFFRERPAAQLVVIPRHPQNLKKFLTRFADCGLNKFSKLGDSFHFALNIAFIPQLGILRGWYQLATCVFVGGSLTSRGGQNFLEPLRLARFTATGPYTNNFAVERAMALKAGGLTIIRNQTELLSFLHQAAFYPSRAKKVANQGYNFCKNQALNNSVDFTANSICSELG